MKTIAVIAMLTLSIYLVKGNPKVGEGLVSQTEDSVNQNTNIHIPESLNGFNEIDIVAEKPSYFFGEDIFESDLFSPFVGTQNTEFLHNHPMIGTYFLLIYPAASWLEEESFNVIEIL